jgi:outer membrane protein assembly factor BamE (lipoprotein component of BamABCDE complex)
MVRLLRNGPKHCCFHFWLLPRLILWDTLQLHFLHFCKMLKPVFKVLSVIVAAFVLAVVFGSGAIMLEESYSPLDPYADTEFAPSYSPAKFEAIKAGMTISQVRRSIGKPLFQSTDALDDQTWTMLYDYTNDGYIRRSGKKHDLIEDLAWYRSRVFFNADSVVTAVDSGWSYD